VLAALLAVGSAKLGAAIQAVRFMRMPIGAWFAGFGLKHATDEPSGNCVAKALEIPHLHPRYSSTLGRLGAPC
jgi:hypothetical protein